MKSRQILILLILFLIVGCAGRVADPVRTRQPGDYNMTCEEILTEMDDIDEEVHILISESNSKSTKNVALGVAGWFLLVPWLFMDLSHSEKVEIRAYRKRYKRLQALSARNHCEGGRRTIHSTG